MKLLFPLIFVSTTAIPAFAEEITGLECTIFYSEDMLTATASAPFKTPEMSFFETPNAIIQWADKDTKVHVVAIANEKRTSIQIEIESTHQGREIHVGSIALGKSGTAILAGKDAYPLTVSCQMTSTSVVKTAP